MIVSDRCDKSLDHLLSVVEKRKEDIEPVSAEGKGLSLVTRGRGRGRSGACDDSWREH